MGYLDNSSITVDAILTKKGRELLAKGQNEFKITSFALADDEIDYTLWNPDHPLGSQYYGSIIENMPITEAVPDESQNMRFKLVTLPKKTVRIPVVSVNRSAITLETSQSEIIIPTTLNYKEGNSTYGYTAILADSDVVTLEVVEQSQATTAFVAPASALLDPSQSVSLIGMKFKITAKPQLTGPKSTTITIYGNETGGSVTISVTVNQQSATYGAGLTQG